MKIPVVPPAGPGPVDDRVWPAVVPGGIVVHGHGTTAPLCNGRCHVVEQVRQAGEAGQ